MTTQNSDLTISHGSHAGEFANPSPSPVQQGADTDLQTLGFLKVELSENRKALVNLNQKTEE